MDPITVDLENDQSIILTASESGIEVSCLSHGHPDTVTITQARAGRFLMALDTARSHADRLSLVKMSRSLKQTREQAEKDAQDTWTCVCGYSNPVSISECGACERTL